MTLLLLTIAAVLFLAGVWSVSEAAILSFPRGRLTALRHRPQPGTPALLFLFDRLPQTIATIVILNNLVTIVGSLAIGSQTAHLLEDTQAGILSGIFTFLLIVFSEVLPKALGEHYAQRIVPWLAPTFRWLVLLLSPLTWLTAQLAQLFTRGSKPSLHTSEEEIRLLTSLGHQEGSIEPDEARMVHRVFHLNDLSAQNLMTPRTRVQTLQTDLLLRDIPETQLDDAYSRILVIGDTPDDVRGVVLKDVVLGHLADDQHHLRVHDLMLPALTVPPEMRADDLVRLFQKKRQHLAAVRRVDGRLLGVVTLEDVLEEIVGEIEDEAD